MHRHLARLAAAPFTLQRAAAPFTLQRAAAPFTLQRAAAPFTLQRAAASANLIRFRTLSTGSDASGGLGSSREGESNWELNSWDEVSSWSTGLSMGDIDGPAVGKPVEHGTPRPTRDRAVSDSFGGWEKELQAGIKKDRKFVDDWDDRFRDTCELLKQAREPGMRGSYLKESEKAEMYKLHRQNPAVFTVERLSKDYRVMRQRVHAILWLKEMEEAEEKRSGKPLDDSIEKLLDECPEFFISHDKEFHVASLPYKPNFTVMPVDWDGTTKDPDEVLYEISVKEDQMMYEEFEEKMNFNRKKIAGEVYHHKYSRRRLPKGWNFTIEKLGPQDKCRRGNAYRFVSMPDGSSRELNEMEKLYARREIPRRRKRMLR